MDVEIKVIEATFLKEPDYSEKQDPYVKFKWKGAIFKSTNKENAGQNPVWNEIFNISEVELGETIVFECFVEVHDGHDFVGVTVPITLMDYDSGANETFQLEERDGAAAGTLTVCFKITDPSKKLVSVDWRKCVSMVPPHVMKFKVLKEDAQNPKIPRMEVKGTAFVEIFNQGEDPILFKIKTTNIQNYMVKPNTDVIPAGRSLVIRVFTQQPIHQTGSLARDKFLVQITKVEDEMTEGIDTSMRAGKLSLNEIQEMWELVDKANILQYKLKADIDVSVAEYLSENDMEPILNRQQLKNQSILRSTQAATGAELRPYPDELEAIEEKQSEYQQSQYTNRKKNDGSASQVELELEDEEEEEEEEDSVAGSASQSESQSMRRPESVFEQSEMTATQRAPFHINESIRESETLRSQRVVPAIDVDAESDIYEAD